MSTDATMTGSDAAIVLRTYERSLDVLESAVRTADPTRWDDRSPCDDWTAREVAGHAMSFIGNVVALAGDGAAPDFHAVIDLAAAAGDDPGRSWTAARHLIEQELLERPERLAARRMTPLGMEMTMLDLLTFQGMDPVVHGWDIATATGGRVTIDDDLAEVYLRALTPVADQLRAAGLLGPARSGGTSPADRLLDLCGRVR